MRLLRLTQIALRGAVRSPLQTSLIALAAVGGVAAMIAADAYAEAGRRKILEQFYAQGVNMIAVSPDQSRAVGGRARTGAIAQTLTLADERALRAATPDLVAASAVVSKGFRIRGGDLTKEAVVVGCEPDYFRIRHWVVRRGELFDAAAVRGQARVALLGSGVAADLFGTEDPTGLRITIDRTPFVVAGVLADRGQRLDTADEDQQVYIPLDTAMRRLMNVDYLSALDVEASTSERMDADSADIRAVLSERHRRFTRGKDDFRIENQKALIDAQTATFDRFAFFARAAAGLALMLAAVGVLSVSWIAVSVRAHEIGVRRALGATRRDVLAEVVGEAEAAGLAGCGLGVAAGAASARGLEAWLGQPAWLSWPDALAAAGLAAVLFAAAIGAASWRALKIEPSEALRQS